MEVIGQLFLFLVIFGLGAAVTVARGLSGYRMRAALDEDLAGDACIACSGTTLVEQHPDALLCGDCGYEQGPGWERRREAAHLEGLASLTADEAQAHARRLLQDARLALLSATGPMRRPVVQEGSGRNARPIINPDLLDAAQDIEQCWKNLQEAALVDPGVATALATAGFVASTTPPDCGGLYDVTTARRTAAALATTVRQTAHQAGKAMEALGMEN